MGALFSDKSRQPARPTPSDRPPPPPPQAAGSFFDDDPDPAPTPRLNKRVPGLRFDAELDVTELDDRDRPGLVWIARGRELSRSHMIFRSRRMCYEGRRILAAVHLIDDRPVPLFGRVTQCEYDGDAMYRVELELLQVPEKPEILAWIDSMGKK